jgi:dTDP-L-rhamnose 4-epimerase
VPGFEGATVLVTGGAGFIGCAVSQRVAAASRRFVVADCLHPQVHPQRARPAGLHPAAELLIEDITEESAWRHILGTVTPTLVVHLAAETGTAQSLTEASRHASVNVLGTARMLDALSARGIRPDAFVLCSSRAVYGEGRWMSRDGTTFYPGQRAHRQLAAGQWDFAGATPLASDAATTEPHPTSVYGATKLAQEHLLAAWCAAADVPLTVLRMQNVYGPGQSLTNSYTGIVSLFSSLARAGQSIPVYEDGAITRDFVFVQDAAAAVAAAAERASTPPLIADVGSGTVTSVLDLANRVAALHDAPAPRVNGCYREGDVRHASCVITRAETLLDWQPKWSLAEGLTALQRWMDAELATAGQTATTEADLAPAGRTAMAPDPT